MSPDPFPERRPGHADEAVATPSSGERRAGANADLFASADGAFDALTAAALTRWKEE